MFSVKVVLETKSRQLLPCRKVRRMLNSVLLQTSVVIRVGSVSCSCFLLCFIQKLSAASNSSRPPSGVFGARKGARCVNVHLMFLQRSPSTLVHLSLSLSLSLSPSPSPALSCSQHHRHKSSSTHSHLFRYSVLATHNYTDRQTA